MAATPVSGVAAFPQRWQIIKQRKTVRVAGPFSVDALIETYLNNTSKVLGYNIRGPGSDPHWLYSEEELATKLEELLASMGGENRA